DIIEIVDSVVKTLPKIQHIYLITNALQSKTVCQAITSLKNVCHEQDVKLNVMVSLDGIGEIHDRVRGRIGNFDSAVRVLDFLQASDAADSTSIGCTVIKANVYGIEGLLDWCMKREIHAYFRLGIPHRRLYNLSKLKPFDLSFQENFHFANFLDYLQANYEKKASKRLFYKSLRNQIIYKKNRSVSCLWQSSGITLSARGEISYCAVESDTLGNALAENPNKIYWGNQKHLSEIIKNKCNSCLHDYGPAPQIFSKPEKLKKKFNKLIPQKIHQIIIKLKQIPKSEVTGLKIKERDRISISKKGEADKNILICGWYGTETLGDKAILGGLIKVIQKCVDWKIDIGSIEPYVTLNTKQQMPELKINNVLHLSEARLAIQNGHYRSVIMGGGPLMGPIRECRDILDLFVRAKEVGATTIVGGCGVGPLGWPEIDSAIAKILNIADLVIFRDQHSRDLARKALGVKRESHVTLDPAFFWAFSESNRNLQKRDPKQILLALRDWSIKDYGSHIDHKSAEQIKDRFENELRTLIKQLMTTDPNLKIIPFCMHKYARGGDDRFFYRRVFADYP
ncbi:MAG: polysaccharide pyruvyl transferase family protein, partial [Desulfobacterales bacterium]